MASAIARAVMAELDEATLDELADRLASRVADRLSLLAPSSDRWLGAKEAAAHLGMSVPALHKLTAAREIPFEQLGPNCRCWFSTADLDAWRRGERPRL